MKKILFAVISFILFSAVNVKAMGPTPQFFIKTSDIDITVGNTVSIDVYLKPNSYNSNYYFSDVFGTLFINYDKNVFEYTSYSGKSSSFKEEDQSIKFTEGVEFTQNEKVGTILLKVKSYPQTGSTTINYYSFYEYVKESVGTYSLNIIEKETISNNDDLSKTDIENKETSVNNDNSKSELFTLENLMFFGFGFMFGGFLILFIAFLKKQNN